MSHAERCPVCGGTGKANPDSEGISANLKPCHGCAPFGSLGWVVVTEAWELTREAINQKKE